MLQTLSRLLPSSKDKKVEKLWLWRLSIEFVLLKQLTTMNIVMR